MENKKYKYTPILFYNSGDENKKAFFSILRSGIRCEFRPAYEGSTPLLLFGYQKFYGTSEIEEFISEYSKKDIKVDKVRDREIEPYIVFES